MCCAPKALLHPSGYEDDLKLLDTCDKQCHTRSAPKPRGNTLRISVTGWAACILVSANAYLQERVVGCVDMVRDVHGSNPIKSNYACTTYLRCLSYLHAYSRKFERVDCQQMQPFLRNDRCSSVFGSNQNLDIIRMRSSAACSLICHSDLDATIRQMFCGVVVS